MRKRVRSSGPPAPAADDWLSLEQLVQVDVTSEDPAAPIEAAVLPTADGGWRGATPGAQTIRLIFDQPHVLRRIWLRCVEREQERTQEVVLRWSPMAATPSTRSCGSNEISVPPTHPRRSKTIRSRWRG